MYVSLSFHQETVSYSLAQREIGSLYFQIDPATGLITLKVSVLRATDTVFVLTVTASDNQPSARTATAYVTVFVVRNPNAPRFDRPLYEVEISEYQTLNQVLAFVKATDLDSPQVNHETIL